MIRTKGRRRLTCHHEAGHALTRWYFGHMTDRAVVLTVEEVRAGKQIERRRGPPVSCEGTVYGYDICNPHHGGPTKLPDNPVLEAEINARRAVDRDVELINCFSGICAEAHYRHSSFDTALFEGGQCDLKGMRALLDGWGLFGDARYTLEGQAQMLAVALVRSPAGAAAIKTMADALMGRGEITGDEIGRLCRVAYGGQQCEFGAWNAHWPPNPAQLRAGFIPEDREQAA